MCSEVSADLSGLVSCGFLSLCSLGSHGVVLNPKEATVCFFFTDPVVSVVFTADDPSVLMWVKFLLFSLSSNVCHYLLPSFRDV